MIADTIKETAAKRNTVFKDKDGDELDRSQFLTASEALNCSRVIKWGKGEELDKNEAWGYFERGHNVEAWLVGVMREAYLPMKYIGADQVSLVDKARGLSATPDGLLVDKLEETVVEIKSFDPRTHASNLPKTEHINQVKIQIELFREQTKHSPDSGVLLYVNASDYRDIREYTVSRDPEILDKMGRRREEIFNAGDALDLVAEGRIDGSCRYCNFADRCSEPMELGAQHALPWDELNSWYETYRLSKQSKEVAEMGMKTAQENIKIEMEVANTGKVVCDDYSITYNKVKGRETLDKDRMKKDKIDLEKYTKVGKPSMRLTIKD